MSSPHNEDAPGRFNLSAWALQHRALVVFLIIMLTVSGALAYTRLAQSEDPPFTFRVMVIKTLWPGATARQVQQQVSDRLARTLQDMPSRDHMASYSRPGESTIFYFMKEAGPASTVPDEWYQIRKKIGDMAGKLPSGVIGPFFNDEIGRAHV